eukprot:TRINITY_DN9583_c0_g1_i1.p1 TRINITY_DN9583_c0_g1~~TRINITY_DN9583_c0_g1_i1.p1  ORF type:complete len:370 (+),score=103.29 TRINITY_DN9583_c0_g1_i1:64-1110(+)
MNDNEEKYHQNIETLIKQANQYLNDSKSDSRKLINYFTCQFQLFQKSYHSIDDLIDNCNNVSYENVEWYGFCRLLLILFIELHTDYLTIGIELMNELIDWSTQKEIILPEFWYQTALFYIRRHNINKFNDIVNLSLKLCKNTSLFHSFYQIYHFLELNEECRNLFELWTISIDDSNDDSEKILTFASDIIHTFTNEALDIYLRECEKNPENLEQFLSLVEIFPEYTEEIFHRICFSPILADFEIWLEFSKYLLINVGYDHTFEVMKKGCDFYIDLLRIHPNAFEKNKDRFHLFQAFFELTQRFGNLEEQEISRNYLHSFYSPQIPSQSKQIANTNRLLAFADKWADDQ